MAEKGMKVATRQNIFTDFVNPGSPVPKKEDFYILPDSFVSCIREIAPKIQKTGVWWAVGGDVSESIGGVTVRPKEIEILTTEEGIEKVIESLAEYKPSPAAVIEKKLDREAEIEGKKYAVTVRSHQIRFTAKGVDVLIHGDYQMRVGEWDWGDPLEFKAPIANIVGVRIPVMPIRLSSEIYLTLGWLDRAQMISDAIQAAHHAHGQYGEEIGGAGYDSQWG